MSQQVSPLHSSPVATGIDCLRGTLAVLVLVSHAVILTQDRQHVSPDSTPWITLTLRHGAFWVNGFFVLSGFCIHQSLVSLRGKEGNWIRQYTLARVTRIYPMYGVALLAALLCWATLGPFAPEQRHLAAMRWTAHLAMVQGITGVIHEMRPAWSLTFEAFYYLAWPVLLVGCGWSIRRTALVGCAISLVVAALIAMVWQVRTGGAETSFMLPLWRVPARFPIWISGALLAHHWHLAASKWFPHLGKLSLAGLLITYLSQNSLESRNAHPGIVMMVELASVLPWLGLLVAFSRWKSANHWHRVAMFWGLLSYPLYILHELLLDIIWRKVPSTGSWAGDMPIFCGGALAIVIALGIPLEAGILQWRGKWLRARRTAQPTEAVAQATTA
jgi:peptidoglycan/LPS O-acetylase OafA/YrhL